MIDITYINIVLAHYIKNQKNDITQHIIFIALERLYARGNPQITLRAKITKQDCKNLDF